VLPGACWRAERARNGTGLPPNADQRSGRCPEEPVVALLGETPLAP
jgi:hypothetical protein